jgi:hypothetical protein
MKGEYIMARYKYDIFRYKKFASCNFLGGNTNSFEVSVKDFTERNLDYKKYDFHDNPLEHKIYTISKNAIEEIKNIIWQNEIVFEVNSSLNNGSLDGAGQKFWFSTEKRNREITAWNIDGSIDDGHKIRKEYLDEYGDDLRQERLVLKIFFEISKILKKKGIVLELYEFQGNTELEYKPEM